MGSIGHADAAVDAAVDVDVDVNNVHRLMCVFFNLSFNLPTNISTA